MSKLRVESFTISLDGFGVGPDQSISNPLGVGGTSLHGWAIPTRTFQKNLFGSDGGETGVDEDYAARGFQNIGAWILGRNMFGPVRGPWPDEKWRGWWGENPLYHVPVFIADALRKRFPLQNIAKRQRGLWFSTETDPHGALLQSSPARNRTKPRRQLRDFPHVLTTFFVNHSHIRLGLCGLRQTLPDGG